MAEMNDSWKDQGIFLFISNTNSLFIFIYRFLRNFLFDWLREVVFQLNLKYLQVIKMKITKSRESLGSI